MLPTRNRSLNCALLHAPSQAEPRVLGQHWGQVALNPYPPPSLKCNHKLREAETKSAQ